MESFFTPVPEDNLPLGAGTYVVSATVLQTGPFLFPGPWSETYEQDYQNLRYFEDELSGRDQLTFYRLTLARLCSFLRHRKPDARIAVNLFVFHLGKEDLRRILLGPPLELATGNPIRGLARPPAPPLP